MDNTPKPRQPLTRKRKAAIFCYVQYRISKTSHTTPSQIVEFTLKAERMDEEKLYTHLQHHGYIYNEKQATWTRGIPN